MSREIKFRAWSEELKLMSNPFGLGGYALSYYTDEFENFPKHLKSLTDEAVMQYTGIQDANGTEIYEGDLFWSTRGYVKSDGYKKKGYPDSIRVLIKVDWQNPKYGTPGFRLTEVKVHEDDLFAEEEYQYRWLNYSNQLKEQRDAHFPQGGSIIWHGCASGIEICGNVFQNPELFQ